MWHCATQQKNQTSSISSVGTAQRMHLNMVPSATAYVSDSTTVVSISDKKNSFKRSYSLKEQ